MIGFFAGHPTAANILMIGFILLGLVFAGTVKRETFPDIPSDSVQVQVPWPGASSADVEQGVCLKLETAADSVDQREETRCEAREGLAVATLVMRQGGDLDRFLEDVKNEVDGVTDFPADAEAPVVRELGRVDVVASIAVAGPLAPAGLKAYAERMKDDLLAIPGVANVEIQGFSQRQIRIEVSASTMRQFGLSVRDLADSVERQSVTLPAGSVQARDSTVLIRFDDERRTPRTFEDLVVVASASGAVIRLGDIAVITDRFEHAGEKNLFNGRRSAWLTVEKGRSDDTLKVIDAVRAYLDEQRALASPGMVLEITSDVASIVRDRLNMLLRNGAQGLVLVFLVIWLFFGLRYSFWLAAGLPVAFMGTIAGMAAIGYSFDMITMVALLIALGLMMDDAIVIAENIARHRAAGRSVVDAAVEGTREVAPGVLASFLTTIGVFGALAFLQGNIGAVMAVLPVVLILTLAFSLVEAFLILPHHLLGTLRARRGASPPRLRALFDAGLARFTEGFVGRLVDAAISWRYLTVGLIAGLFLVSVAAMAGGVVKFRTFPNVEGNVIEADLLLYPGTPLARTEAVVERVVAAVRAVDEAYAAERPGGANMVRNIGVRFSRNRHANETGEHLATVTVDLVGPDSRYASLDEIMNRWRARVGVPPDVIALTFGEPELGPAGRPIDIRLVGKDMESLKAAALELREWLRGYRGVFDLTDDLRLGKPELRVRLREGALALGMTASEVARQLRAAFQGRHAGEFQIGSEDYEVDVRLYERDRDSLADLARFTVTLPTGEQVPLHAVATLTSERGYSRIHRVNGGRAVTVRGDLDPDKANSAEIIADTQSRFWPGLEARYPGIRMELEGEARESAETGASLGRNFLVGLAAIFLLLSFQFRGYIEPLVIMASIPVGLVGVVIGHLAMGLELSMPSLVGFVSLAGVVVNNAIVLVVFIKIRRARGEAAEAAARGASRERFRPVLLTSLTTVAGVLPLLMETSLQAQVLVPLVTSLAFGLAASTFQVLFLVPALYCIVDDYGGTVAVETAAEPAARVT